ncbi:HEPN domain-containing protein [Niabella beijingensis]|uniref:ApeA N-terminal domain 1-containing protein n=1 Tax=Niabella beijingensis TaxID=2872700 RepID=UPI001CBCBB5A|nr:HEPN domain-containing protein [Niabella beijingensis]MBZ4192159.1 hypothetical protein [Niabella beijingensis]
MKDLKYYVRWQIEGDEEKYYGILEYKEECFFVILFDCYSVPSKVNNIYGDSTDGKKITLHNCLFTNKKMSLQGIPTITVMAHLCFIGGHFKVEEARFQSVNLVYSSLNEWFDIRGLKYADIQSKSVSISYEVPQTRVFYEREDLTMGVTFQGTWPLFSVDHEFVLKQQTSILVKYAPGFTLDDFWNYDTILTGFFALAYFSEAHLTAISFIRDSENITCFYSGQDVDFKNKTRNKRFLFTYKDIQKDFSAIFKKWIDILSITEPAVLILTESFNSQNKVGENLFLNIIQAIETFHRTTRNNEVEPKHIHKHKINGILSGCPEEYRQWLKDKLNFSNEPTLQERLVELFDELSNEITDHLYPDKAELIKNAKNTRNYLTHYDRSLKKKALSGIKLYYLTERLQIFLLILVLKELGIEQDKINKMITKESHGLFNHVIVKKSVHENINFLNKK